MHEARETPEAYRRRTVAALGPPHRLSELPWEELRQFPIFPGTTLGSTPIAVPIDWLPHNAARQSGKRLIDPTLPGILHQHRSETDGKRIEAIRRCLLALWLTRRSDAGALNYKPSSWANMAQLFLRVAAEAVRLRPDVPELFEGMSTADIRLVVTKAGGGSESTKRVMATLLRYLTDAGERGVLSDFPLRRSNDRRLASLSPTDREAVEGGGDTQLEQALAGVNVRWRMPTAEESSGLPFSDEFVTAVIGGAVWVQRNIADSILDCLEVAREVEWEIRQACGSTKFNYVAKKQTLAIIDFEWPCVNGRQVSRADLDDAFGVPIATAWPPRNMRELGRWVTILQALNVQVLAFCTGARKSEIGAAGDACVNGDHGEPNFVSRTFKTARQIDGDVRDWPLHPVGAEAVRIQIRLASLFRSGGADHLWTALTDRHLSRGDALVDLTTPVVRAIAYLGLDGLARSRDDVDEDGEISNAVTPGKSRTKASLHRWRHTVARLVALSIVEAPHVLMRLFGHKSLEMTLHYMLSAEGIAEEAMRVANEARLVLAERALEETLKDETSGAASARLAATLKDYGVVGDPYASPVDDDEDDDGRGPATESLASREVGRALVENRRPWSGVAPGIHCTKNWNEFGPCTQGWGAPDIGACRTGCTFRLEMSSARDQCRKQVEALIADVARFTKDGETMRALNAKGKLRANLVRWPEVRREFLGMSEVAREVWGTPS